MANRVGPLSVQCRMRKIPFSSVCFLLVLLETQFRVDVIVDPLLFHALLTPSAIHTAEGK